MLFLLLAGGLCLAASFAGMALGVYLTNEVFHDNVQLLDQQAGLSNAHLDRVLAADDAREA